MTAPRDDNAQTTHSHGIGHRVWHSAYLLLTFTALFWAGNSIVARAARELLPPLALAFWRWSIALVIILPFAWRHLRRDRAVLRREWKMVIVLGVLGIGSFNTLLYTGLQTTTALNALLLQAAQPGVILILGVALFRDGATRAQVGGVMLAALGTLTIIGKGDINALIHLRFNTGDLVIALGVLLWSLYSVLLRHRPAVHPLSFLAATLVVGVCLIAPFYALELASGRYIVPTADSFAAIAYVSLLPSVVAYLFFNRSVELIGSAATGQFLNVMPVIGAALAIAILGETLGTFHIVGVMLIGAGILWSSRRDRPATPIARG